jgi:Protein of unknown function (DUF1501)
MTSHRHTTGLNRRELLQVGYSGLLGLGLPAVLGAQTSAAESNRATGPGAGKAKSVVIVFLTGACSHHDTFDMKPQAPDAIRGEFKPISTAVPELQICEHLPRLAARAKKYAVIRSLSHGDNNHLMSTHYVLTGTKQPGGFFDKVASRDDWPCYSSALSFLRPRADGLPSGVNLPKFLVEGPLTWPGQHAGFLGAKYDPWQITADPNKKGFKVDALTLAPGVDVTRLNHRRSLLGELDRQQRTMGEIAEARRMAHDQQLAFTMLTSSRLARAFELHRESDAVRDRYGRNTHGQSLLLARRLVQAQVPVVQVNIGRVQTWDNHGNIFPTLKNRLLPPLDQGVAALLDDLEAQGRLDETLVMMLGEFGRTPKINKGRGRDHWGHCFFGVFAGAGIRGGQIIGRSDATAAYPLTTPFSPDDVGATVYHALGIPPEVQVRDRVNRPVRLNRGKWIRALYTDSRRESE